MQSIIQLRHVTKMYGKSRGIIDVSLKVPKGAVFGFLGPNGAGKTTTINMMVNLTRPTQGQIKLFGKDATQFGLENRARVGFLAGDMALDKGLTGWQQLEYFGNLRGRFDKEYVHELSSRLNSNLSTKIKNLSRGNRQKVALIAALMHRPDLIILDEPTNGLDPLVQAEFNNIILEHQKAGKTAFISSHILSEVQELCDEIAIIRDGKIITQTSMKEIIAAAPRVVRLSTNGSYHPAQLVAELKGVSNLYRHDHSVSFSFTGDVNDLLQCLTKRPLRTVAIQEAQLEDIFMGYYTGNEENEDV